MMMKSRPSQIVWLFVLLNCLISSSVFGETPSPLSETVNQVAGRLEAGENPDTIFSFQISKIPDQEVRVVWLDPKKWIVKGNPKELSSYVGLLTFVRLKAPFHRVQQALTAYQDTPKFTPGLIGTKVIEWKRVSSEKSVILINRKREMPALLAGLKDADYNIRNEVKIKDQDFVLIRSSLALEGGKAGVRDVMQEMEGFEYAHRLDDGKTIYIAGVFTLPNTGIIPMRAPEDHADEDKKSKNLLTSSLGLVKSKLEILDVRTHFFEIISKSVLEDAFRATAGLMQVTTDSRWRDKWTHQLTPGDSKKIFKENESLFKQAKKNGWITFPA